LKVTTSTRLAELLRELVGGEGLAEAHLGVPQEARHGVRVLGPDGLVVVVGLVHRLRLLVAQAKGLVVRAAEGLAGAQLGQHGAHIGHVQRIHSSATFSKPFLTSAARTSWSLKICRRRARRLVQFDGEVLDGGRLELLGHALLHVARGLAHLELARVRRIGNGVGVDARAGLGLGGEDFLDGLTHRARYD
jgi:hypothetical protein